MDALFRHTVALISLQHPTGDCRVRRGTALGASAVVGCPEAEAARLDQERRAAKMKLIALLALLGAVAAGVVFSRRRRNSLSSTWASAKESTSDWATTARDQAGEVARSAASAAGDAANAAPQVAEDMKDAFGGNAEPAV
jgi:hypothetical protein